MNEIIVEKIDEKLEKWLNHLRLFGLNAQVHCSREEKTLGQEHIGTRHVNVAYHQMIKHMHSDMNLPYAHELPFDHVVEGGKQVLLFQLGDANYYTDLSAIHEILTYPVKNYRQFQVEGNFPMTGLLNWYEGIIPVIHSQGLLEESASEYSDAQFLLVYDVGKEIYGFTVTRVLSTYEIDASTYGADFQMDHQVFKCLDYTKYEKTLIQNRLSLQMD